MIIRYMIFLFFTTMSVSSVQAAPGCMDNSYHAQPCAPYDYKNYRYVKCNCRCERYAQLYKRGICGGCHHFRVPTEQKLDAYVSKPFASRPRVDNKGRIKG